MKVVEQAWGVRIGRPRQILGASRRRRQSACRTGFTRQFAWQGQRRRSACAELSTGQAIDPRHGIAATTFYDQIKAFFADCASVLRGQGDPKGAERFAKASTHWMRHSHASHAIAGGMPIEIAQQNLGHASLATTTVYVTTEKRRRMKAVEAFWAR